jgi:4-hydroxybenzoate polyprenyltransferase
MTTKAPQFSEESGSSSLLPEQSAPQRSSLFEFLESIKFSHSIFALPFAVIATLLARRGNLPSVQECLFIVLAMVGARTWAMCINRVADAHIDAKNPRTQQRAVPAGRIATHLMLTYAFAGALLFIASAAALSMTAFWCSVPVLVILASYSYTKRFTFLCHFWLGMCLGLAPLGAWVALRNEFSLEMAVLSVAICFWVAGFDILYAMQDQDFDKKERLFSIPSRFGTRISLWTARASHALSAVLFTSFGIIFQLGWLYFVGLAFSAALMFYEHWVVRKGDLKEIDMAFFNLNGWIAVMMLFATALALYV